MDIYLSFPALRKGCVIKERLLGLGSSALTNCFRFQITNQLTILVWCKLQTDLDWGNSIVILLGGVSILAVWGWWYPIGLLGVELLFGRIFGFLLLWSVGVFDFLCLFLPRSVAMRPFFSTSVNRGIPLLVNAEVEVFPVVPGRVSGKVRWKVRSIKRGKMFGKWELLPGLLFNFFFRKWKCLRLRVFTPYPFWGGLESESVRKLRVVTSSPVYFDF